MKKLEVERLLHSFHVEPKHRKKKQCHIPDADEHFKHSDYRADGIWHCFFFRLFPLFGERQHSLDGLKSPFFKKIYLSKTAYFRRICRFFKIVLK